tara:strand:- start:1329 stop:2144 length:816 start_codon:yes stop_codon:yes gene_type:complete
VAAKLVLHFSKANSVIAYGAVQSVISFSGLSATDITLDADTKNQYITGHAISFTDSPAILFTKGLSESLFGFLDNATFTFNKAVTESVSFGDATSITTTFIRDFTDSLALSELAAFDVGLVKVDSVGFSDAASFDFTKSATDAASLSEIALLHPTLNKAHSVSTADVFSRAVTYSRSLTDFFTLDDFTDIYAVSKNTTAAKGNAFGFSDSVTVTTTTGLTDAFSASDAISNHPTKSLTDSTSLSDSVTIQLLSMASSVLNASAINVATLNR